MASTITTDTINYSDMRRKLSDHLEACTKFGKRFKIVRNGKPEAILLSVTEWEQILETLAIVTNPHLMEQIIQSAKDIKAGKVQPLDEAFSALLEEG